MAVIANVKAPEQWMMEVNGGYSILFSDVVLGADAVDGQVIAAPVAGIVSEGGLLGETVRVMVRGNPSKVDSNQLTGSTAGLAAINIIAV